MNQRSTLFFPRFAVNVCAFVFAFALTFMLFHRGTLHGQSAQITSTSPARNSNTAAVSTPLNIGFTQVMGVGAASQTGIKIFGGMTGLRTGTYSGGGTTNITFTPSRPYFPGELVSATITANAQTLGMSSAQPSVVQFRARAGAGAGRFLVQTLSSPFAVSAAEPIAVAFADMDNDNDIDMVTANYGGGGGSTMTMFRNDGTGSYTPFAPTSLGAAFGPRDIAVGDMDSDGDADAVVVCENSGHIVVALST